MKLLQISSFLFIFVTSSTSEANRCGYSSSVDKYLNIFNPSNEAAKKILNGEDASEGDWPWIVYRLYRRQNRSCTASIIHKKWILTAAHCCPQNDAELIDIFVGSRNATNGSVYKISELFIHPEYVPSLFNNDICLMKLEEELNFNSNIQPICLHRNVTFDNNDIIVAAGWGSMFNYVEKPYNHSGKHDKDDVNVRYPSILQETIVMLNDYCYDYLYNESETNESEDEFFKSKVCIGGLNKGTYSGDSGGPLMVLKDKRWIQIGVLSQGGLFDYRKSRIDVYVLNLYIRVSYYCDWIEEITDGDVQCID